MQTVNPLKGKVGVITFYKGNYGSTLQCYATCAFLKKMGYAPYVLEEETKRYKNVWNLFVRCLARPTRIKTFLTLRKAANRTRLYTSAENKRKMQTFIEGNLPVLSVKDKKALKRIGRAREFTAFLSGSDQIWNGHQYSVNSAYFLRFCPKEKRIAWSPSLGTKRIASYNERLYKKYISDYAALSAREFSGVKEIETLTGKKVEKLVDPVFLLTGEEWRALGAKKTEGKYVLCYFLDEPKEKTLEAIEEYCKENKAIPVVFGNEYPIYKRLSDYQTETGDPASFLSSVDGASRLFTDSFHGVSFATILHTPFYVYSRNYQHDADQSARIESLLQLTGMQAAFNTQAGREIAWDFAYADRVIEEERKKMTAYFTKALEKKGEE